jgi:NAD-dependent dihydropyrimidine dehydrogenase PreA subunit
MGTFIKIEIDADKITSQIAQKLVSTCPVDIFVLEGNALGKNLKNEDECTLCELCLEIAPARTVVIRKTYKEEILISRG